MKFFKYILLIILLLGTVHASQRKVLVEVFTNSHCPLCPPAHSAIESFIQSDPNSSNVTYIFYHMVFPYPDDPLNQANPEDSADRNKFYGPFYATPRGIFDGQVQSNSYSSWAHNIDDMTTTNSPFELNIKAQGQLQGGNLTLTASVKQTAAVNVSDLRIYFVAVENTNYTGRNGVTNNINVMRKMFPGSSGKSLSTTLNQTVDVNQEVTIDSKWNVEDLGFVVFVQDNQNKMVYQSAYMTLNSLVTDVEKTGSTLPSSFTLNQNYPNPFNPSTTIEYSIPTQSQVELHVFDVLGNKVVTLVDGEKSPGKYRVVFNGSRYASGVYFYRLQVKSNSTESKKDFIQIRKMLYLK